MDVSSVLAQLLFRKGLQAIDSPQLVERYNEALSQLGLAPTTLERFHLDKMGWSPEVAAERQDKHYLSHGEANPLAIIISPDQAHCDAYAPLCSLDEAMLSAFYSSHAAAIADICQDSGLCLDMDQGLSRYQQPKDLLLISQVTAVASAGDFMLRAKAQASLVQHFLNDPMAWFHEGYRQRLIHSAKEDGDFRHRRLIIPELHFYEVDNFYADVFGGVFCLKLNDVSRKVLIMVDRQNYERYGKRSQKILYFGDEAVVTLLLKEALLDIDLRGYQENPQVLRPKYEALLADCLCQLEPELDYGQLSQPQIKKLIQDLMPQLPALVFELEKLMLRLEAGQSIRVEQLSAPLQLLLLHPHARVKGQQRQVVLQLLNRWQGFDALQHYKTDKPLFFTQFARWTHAKQHWFLSLLDP